MGVRGHRALAIAVLKLAIRDAAGIVEMRGFSERGDTKRGRRAPRDRPGSLTEIQEAALVWLTEPSDSLKFWCDMADIDEDTVIDGAEGAIKRIWLKSRVKKS